MENVNEMIDYLLQRREEKNKKLEEEKYEEYGIIRNNLIDLLKKLNPHAVSYGKLRKLYDGDGYKYTTYVIGKTDKLHFLKLSYDEEKKEFILVMELYFDYIYNIDKLSKMTNKEFCHQFELFNLKTNDTFNTIFIDVMMNIKEWLQKLAKEVE